MPAGVDDGDLGSDQIRLIRVIRDIVLPAGEVAVAVAVVLIAIRISRSAH
jgi:hypothetical protein